MSSTARVSRAKSRTRRWRRILSLDHNSVTFQVGKDREPQEVCELKMIEALPGFSGGNMTGRSKAEA